MTFIDFFAGLGGFTAGLTQAGFTCIGFCEKDKYAIKSYQAIHTPNEKEWFNDDITKLESSGIPYADGWTAGFPCQDNAEEIVIPKKRECGCRTINTPHFPTCASRKLRDNKLIMCTAV